MLIRYMINRIMNWLFFNEKYLTRMRRKALKKTRAAHSFFQRLTTHPREIFFIKKITSGLSSIYHTNIDGELR